MAPLPKHGEAVTGGFFPAQIPPPACGCTGFAMTLLLQEVRCKSGGRTGASAPTDNMRICTGPERVVQEADPYARLSVDLP